ncbi:uncharacterized protein LOC119433175 isoform X3 [Dermacentor silvarum]|uniref:uncharacterized protein LOC119433175 isoform X3 n=1 Tax=Dermacentor silvarum TaxID=543639 RepID=UPI001898F098|nr:uncharacterized protein LOC119433175 isoform X3 [Dermacentor silvarum]
MGRQDQRCRTSGGRERSATAERRRAEGLQMRSMYHRLRAMVPGLSPGSHRCVTFAEIVRGACGYIRHLEETLEGSDNVSDTDNHVTSCPPTSPEEQQRIQYTSLWYTRCDWRTGRVMPSSSAHRAVFRPSCACTQPSAGPVPPPSSGSTQPDARPVLRRASDCIQPDARHVGNQCRRRHSDLPGIYLRATSCWRRRFGILDPAAVQLE